MARVVQPLVHSRFPCDLAERVREVVGAQRWAEQVSEREPLRRVPFPGPERVLGLAEPLRLQRLDRQRAQWDDPLTSPCCS